MSKKVLVVNLNKNSEYQQVLNGWPQTCGMRSGRVYLEPGQDCGQHSTNAHEEILVFLSGKGQALIGDKNIPYQVAEGKVLYIPPHTAHNIESAGAEPLVYIYCVAPVEKTDEAK